MTIFNPAAQADLKKRLSQSDTHLIVACCCAAWCDTCRAYQPDFERLAQQYPKHTFIWVDIEEHPEFLGDADIEDFPTVLIQTQEKTLFFGPQLPYIDHLAALIDSLENSDLQIDGAPPLIYHQING